MGTLTDMGCICIIIKIANNCVLWKYKAIITVILEKTWSMDVLVFKCYYIRAKYDFWVLNSSSTLWEYDFQTDWGTTFRNDISLAQKGVCACNGRKDQQEIGNFGIGPERIPLSQHLK